MNRKLAFLLLALLIVSILINLFLTREIIVFDKMAEGRFYNRIKKLGWLDEKVPFEEVKSPNTMIALAIGQSNAASTSNQTYTTKNAVFSYYKGSLYKAMEPLLGSGGDGGCVWTILADKLIDSGLYQKVILIPIAVGSTRIEDWTVGKESKKLNEVLDDLNSKGIKLTHIFWHQGESNTGDDKNNYKANLKLLLRNIRKHNQPAPFYCSVATYNFYVNNAFNGVDTVLQNAQKEFVLENDNVISGPNTDSIIYAIDRYDSQHFSAIGNLKYADLWFKALKNSFE